MRGLSGRVLVIDAHERGAVAACRSLAHAGYEVSAGAGDWPAPGLWSRSCTHRFRLPRAETEPEAFAARLAEVLVSHEQSVLLVGGDASLRAISAHRDLVEPHVRIGLPDARVVERSLDRLEFYGAAREVGIPVPETAVCEGHAQAARAASRFGFPVMVKPRCAGVFSERLKDRRSRVAWDERSLAQLVTRLGGRCLVQRRESGTVCSCAGVMTREGLLALVFSRYGRTWPPDAGNCAFAISMAPPPIVEATVEPLLGEIGWTGIFELELLWRDNATLLPLDFNPRLYGSLALAERAGVPLPAVWCDWLLGRRRRRLTSRPGVRYRWEDGDARHALWQLRRGDVLGSARTVRPRWNVVHAYFWWRDPAPLVAQILYLARRTTVHLGRRIARVARRRKQQ